jgi:hypothetical protein
MATKIDEKMILVCTVCGRTVIKRSSNQKYCNTCSDKKDGERKMQWAEKNKEGVARTMKKHTSSVRPFLLEARKERSAAEASLTWMQDDKFIQNFDLMFSFKIPFDRNLSKNSLWRTGKHGHTYLRQEARNLKETIGDIVARSGIKWRTNKLYLKILVQKPDMRGDAINFIDTIADGVKLGVHLDDNWFSIAGVDWEICKDNPQVVIGLYQEDKDLIYCSNCGVPQGFDGFASNVKNKYGVAQPCKECSRLAREMRKNSLRQ